MLLAYVPFAFGLIPSGSSPEVLRSKTGFCFWLILRGLTKQQKRVHLLGLSKNKETSDDHPFYSRKHSLHWALSIVIKMRSCWTYPLPLLVTQLGWQSSVRENSFILSRDSAFSLSCKDRSCCPRGALQMPTHLQWGREKVSLTPFSPALSIPFPSGNGSPVLGSSRLLSQFRWIGNFIPILFRDVGKTSSINPHIRTMYNIKDTSLPWEYQCRKPWFTAPMPSVTSNSGPFQSVSRIGQHPELSILVKKSGFYTWSGFLKVGPWNIRHLESKGFMDTEMHFIEQTGWGWGRAVRPITVDHTPGYRSLIPEAPGSEPGAGKG